MMELYFNVWIDRVQEPGAAQKKVDAYLDDMSDEFNEAILEYRLEMQQKAFYGGFAMAMQLAAECFAENQKGDCIG